MLECHQVSSREGYLKRCKFRTRLKHSETKHFPAAFLEITLDKIKSPLEEVPGRQDGKLAIIPGIVWTHTRLIKVVRGLKASTMVSVNRRNLVVRE